MYIFPTKVSGALNVGFKNIMLLIQASIAWVSIISKILQGHQQANSPAAFFPDKVQTYASSGRNEAIFSNDA